MKPTPESLRGDALLRLERTRAAWLVRCANSQATSDGEQARTQAGNLSLGSPLNTALSEWLAVELSARLWPEDSTSGEAPGAGSVNGATAAPQALLGWTDRHPWLCVLAGLLAGGLAMSQRQRLLRWGISTGLPWLTSQAAVVAVPLLAQWLTRQPPRAASPEENAPPAEGPPAAGVTTETGADLASELSAANSPASGSPA